MVRNYQPGVSVVAGVGKYKQYKGLLNLLIRLDAGMVFMQYAGFARSGKPYMGVGRNLSYKKELFFKNRGFASHLHLQSGDDDLFINEVANHDNFRIESNPASFTLSEPKKSWTEWMYQKKRHLSTGWHYRSQIKNLLFLEVLSRIIFFFGFPVIVLFRPDTLIILSVFGFVLIIKALVYYLVFRRLNDKYLFLPSLLIDPFLPFFYGWMHLKNSLNRKNNRWQ